MPRSVLAVVCISFRPERLDKRLTNLKLPKRGRQTMLSVRSCRSVVGPQRVPAMAMFAINAFHGEINAIAWNSSIQNERHSEVNF